jgi:hypothetical protein
MADRTQQYSMYGHIRQLAEAEKEGIEKAGGTADIYQYVPSHIGKPPRENMRLTCDTGSPRPSPRRC